MLSRISLGAASAAILLLPACGPQYQRKALIPIREKAAQYQEIKNGVMLCATRLNRHEADAIFDGRGKHFFSINNPIYPVQITVTNKSTDEISFDPAKTTLKFANPKSVANRLQYQTAFNTAGIIGAGLVGLIILTPLTVVATLVAAFSGSTIAGIAGIGGAAALAGLLVLTPTASIYYGNSWSKVNQEISTDLRCKVAQCKPDNGIVTIKPEEELSFIIFADGKSFKPQFDLTIEKQNRAIIFNVDLNKKQNN